MNGNRSCMSLEYDKFVNDFEQYFSRYENTKYKTTIIRRTLKKIKDIELPSREDYRLFQIRNFTNSKNLNINFIGNNLWCKKNENNELVVGNLSPYWSSGWKNICDDEFASDQISLFFYLVNQYIQRSYQINLILSISLTYGRRCDFRGDNIWTYTLPICDQEFFDFNNSISVNSNTRITRLEHYLDITNSLDIYVNKASFYYLKATELYEQGFAEEAITNLDNTIDTVAQYIKKNLRSPTLPRKKMIELAANEIGLDLRVQAELEKLYLLRCRFSSHPAQSKWWDFGELYYDDIDKLFDSVKYVLIKMLLYETRNRTISPNPTNWSEWFIKHAHTLFEAIWFHKIP